MITVPSALLIVNADDYGLTVGVNRGIESACEHGIVTSTSVMVNQPATEEVAGLATRCPALGIGLHITFTAGAPVLDPSTVPTLVDGDGQFRSRLAFVALLSKGAVDPADLRREAAAQLERLRALGVHPDHWNVHQHVQEWLAVARPTAYAMYESGLRVCRTSRRYTRTATPIERAAEALRSARRRSARHELARLHRSPDRLLDLPPARWPLAFKALPRGVTVEALCHPDERADAGASMSDSGRARAKDLHDVRDPALRATLEEEGIALTTFAQALSASERSRSGRAAGRA